MPPQCPLCCIHLLTLTMKEQESRVLPPCHQLQICSFFSPSLWNCISYKLPYTGALWNKHPNSWGSVTDLDSEWQPPLLVLLVPGWLHTCGLIWVGGEGVKWQATRAIGPHFTLLVYKGCMACRKWTAIGTIEASAFLPNSRTIYLQACWVGSQATVAQIARELVWTLQESRNHFCTPTGNQYPAWPFI